MLHALQCMFKTKNKMKNLNQNVKKAIYGVLVSLLALAAALLGLSSCNVTRTITTESQSLQKGDTAIIIQTKTIESYNAIKNS